jgi:arylsulfatase A-like enzyme
LACKGNHPPPAAAVAAPPLRPRHVFFLTVDTLRADHMSLYGYPRQTSPHAEELARQGVAFDHAITQWPKTGSSFAAMFTGLYPHSTGLTHKAALRIPDSYLTLPQFLHEEGYKTVGVVSNAVLAASLGWNRGFDDFAQTWGSGEFPDDPLQFRRLASARKVNELALPLLAKYAKEPHLFAWIHYSDPHAPYVLEPGEKNPFLDDGLSPPGVEERQIPVRLVAKGYVLAGHTDLAYYVASYDANVRVADAAIREILETLRRLNLLDGSLVIVAADHGESLGEHRSWFEHGPLPYNTTGRVPLVFAGTGIAAGRRVDRPVELIDLYPTLRDLVDPTREIPGLEGKSLVPFLRAAGPTDAEAGRFTHSFLEAGRHPNLYHSVQEGRWKLVFNSGGKHSRAGDSPTAGFELYDLSRDPLETDDLAAEQIEVVRRLKRDLVAWMRQARAMGGEDEENGETARALRALGYIN